MQGAGICIGMGREGGGKREGCTFVNSSGQDVWSRS